MLRKYFFYFSLVTFLCFSSISKAENTETKSGLKPGNNNVIRYYWKGELKQLEKFKIIINGIGSPFIEFRQNDPVAELIRSKLPLIRYHSSDLYFPKVRNVITVKPNIKTDSPFIVHQAGREVCYMDLRQNEVSECTFTTPTPPKFLLEKLDLNKNTALQHMSIENIEKLSEDYFVKPHYIKARGYNKYRDNHIDVNQYDYDLEKLYSIKLTDVPHIQGTASKSQADDASFFVMFSADESNIYPLDKSGVVYGDSVVKIGEKYYVFANLTKRQLQRIAAF